MTINVFIKYNKEKNLFEIYDNSYSDTELPTITDWYVQITNPYGKVVKVDVIDYLYNVKPEASEIGKIKASDFNKDKLEDGLYKLDYKMNEFELHDRFVMYDNIQTVLEDIIEKTNYQVNIGDFGIDEVSLKDDTKADLERITLVNSFLDELKIETISDDRIKEIINDCNLLLEIIN